MSTLLFQAVYVAFVRKTQNRCYIRTWTFSELVRVFRMYNQATSQPSIGDS